MSVDQPQIIDIISRDKNGDIVLTISDHLDWENTPEHLFVLQEKINTYLRFVESGEIFEKYPDARGHEVVIQVMFHYQPSAGASTFLTKAEKTVEDAGIGFRAELFSATPFRI